MPVGMGRSPARPYKRLTLEPHPRVSPGCRYEREYQSLSSCFGAPRATRAAVDPSRKEDWTCKFSTSGALLVDVGKDVIAVAVRLPGDGPDGRATVKRTFKTFYGVLGAAARWLTGQGVTHVAMEATGIYSMPVYHALIEHGDFERVLVCNAGHVKNVPGRAWMRSATARWDTPALGAIKSKLCGHPGCTWSFAGTPASVSRRAYAMASLRRMSSWATSMWVLCARRRPVETRGRADGFTLFRPAVLHGVDRGGADYCER